MLVLARKEQERIFLGKDITITVVSITGRSVHLGIEAPFSINIERDDIINKKPMDRENFDG